MKKILVIDDEPRLAEALRSFLEQRGFSVAVESDGISGHAAARRAPPDLVLSDVLLPGLSGFNLCKKLQESPALSKIPVLLMTGVYKGTRYRQEAQKCGAAGFILKPFEFSDLLRKVEELLGPAGRPADEWGTLQSQLDDIRAAYAAELPAKLEKIQSALTGKGGTLGLESLTATHRLVHGLCGSGAIFGFSAMAGAARELERALKTFVEASQIPDAPGKKRIAELIETLKTAARSPDGARLKDGAPRPAAAPRAETPRLVYLVEDDASLAQDLALQIGHFGYQVRTIEKLADLPSAYRQSRPAAIVMDIVFPEGNLAGAEIVIQAKRRLSDFPPVLFVSSRTDLAARLMAVRAGGQGYFTKPVNVSELVDRLDSLTARELPQQYRVLIVEDDTALAAHYAAALRRASVQAEVVSDPLLVMGPLLEFRPDLLLMDLYMPSCSGVELASVIRQMEAFVGIPIVFLSAETRLDKQQRALMLGGDDFMTKPVKEDRLVAAVCSRIKRSRALRAHMVRDGLTGLYNHTRIAEQLGMEVSRSQRVGGKLSFAMIDLDHFREVNDTHGHLAGDRVLKSLARLLLQRLRKSDVVGRYGGEEFAVILPDTEESGALKVFRELRESFERLVHSSEKGEFRVTFSCGLACFPRHKDSSRLALAADKALYRAKSEGRNRIVLEA